MITARLQHWLDAVRATSPQRCALGSVAILSIVVALASSRTSAGESVGWFTSLIVLTAVVAAVQAGSHTALCVIALVVAYWLGTVDDVTTGRSIVVASCLFVFHGALALMAVTPHSATIHRQVLRRWAIRTAVVIAAVAGVWLLVRTFEHRNAGANPTLTLLAMLALTASIVALLHHSLDERHT